MNKAAIAQIAHEMNKAYCESIGDATQPSWAEAPQWQKDSAIAGVQFHLDNPEASPSASHDSWMKQKTEEGWKYGPVKNPEAKEHPCYVPYDQLPVEQRSKDYIFKQVIHSLKPFLSPVSDVPTFGEKAVGFTFNPSGMGMVDTCKKTFANAIDQMADLRNNTASGEQRRLASVAITESQAAQMWAVKALTWKD